MPAAEMPYKLFMLFLVATNTLWAQDKTVNSGVFEGTNDALQTRYFSPQNKERNCTGGFLAKTCMSIYPVVSQSFDKSSKAIYLVLQVKLASSAPHSNFTEATLAFGFSGHVVKTDADFQRNSDSEIDGATTDISDERLIRGLAVAPSAWVTLLFPDSISIQISQSQLAGIRLLVQKYDGIEPLAQSADGQASIDIRMKQLQDRANALKVQDDECDERMRAWEKRCTTSELRRVCLLDEKELLQTRQRIRSEQLLVIDDFLSLLPTEGQPKEVKEAIDAFYKARASNTEDSQQISNRLNQIAKDLIETKSP